MRRSMRIFFYLVSNSVIANEANECWFFHCVPLVARCILHTPRRLRIATTYAHYHLYFVYKHNFPWILFPVIYLNKESRWKKMACDVVIIPINVYYTCWFYLHDSCSFRSYDNYKCKIFFHYAVVVFLCLILNCVKNDLSIICIM